MRLLEHLSVTDECCWLLGSTVVLIDIYDQAGCDRAVRRGIFDITDIYVPAASITVLSLYSTFKLQRLNEYLDAKSISLPSVHPNFRI